MKYRLESQTKTADFHWIFHFDTITDQSNAPPVFFCEPCVVVGVKRWALFKHFNMIYEGVTCGTVKGFI